MKGRYTCDDNSQTNESQEKVRNQLKYGALMGEAKSSIQYSLQDGDDELLHLIKTYNNQKEQKHMESLQVQSRKRRDTSYQVITTSEDNLVDIQNIQDPIYHQPKGQIPFKRLRSTAEKGHKAAQKLLSEITQNERQR